jgi:hypothetical protein
MKLKLLYFLLVIISTGCSVRYRDFTKIKSGPKLGSVSLQVINLSPQLLNSDFEAAVKQQCAHSLQKKGYVLSDKQALFHLTVAIKVDSAISSGMAYYGHGVQYPYSRKSKGILLSMEAHNNKLKRRSWENQYDLYYFGDFARDVKRTKGVVSYMIASFNKPI